MEQLGKKNKVNALGPKKTGTSSTKATERGKGNVKEETKPDATHRMGGRRLPAVEKRTKKPAQTESSETRIHHR